MPDRSRVDVEPPATLRCPMAEAVAAWLRDDVAPAVQGAGLSAQGDRQLRFLRMPRPQPWRSAASSPSTVAPMRSISGHSRSPTARRLARPIATVSREVRADMRVGACAALHDRAGPGLGRFSRGPRARRSCRALRGYRMCQWDVRDPQPVAVVEWVARRGAGVRSAGAVAAAEARRPGDRRASRGEADPAVNATAPTCGRRRLELER